MANTEGTRGEAPAVARCELHGLHYPVPGPGCVVCRRAAGLSVAPAASAPRAPRGRALAVLAAAALLLVGLTAAALQLRRADDLRIGAFDDPDGNDDFVDCTRACAETNEACATACPEGQLACGNDCLATFSECSLACGLEHHGKTNPAAFAYATPTMPAWPDVLLAFQPTFAALSQCNASDRSLLLRVAASGMAGTRAEISVLPRHGGAAYSECARAALAPMKPPAATAGYAFVAVIDPSEDVLLRAQRSARLDVARARKHGDPKAAARAQQQVWELQAKIEESARAERLEQQKRAEQERRRRDAIAAQSQWQANPYIPPRYRPPDSPRADRTQPRSDYDRDQSSRYRSYSEYETQAELERMNARKKWEEQRAEERKREEVERLDREAQMKEVEKLGW